MKNEINQYSSITNSRKIIFVSSFPGEWGGCEELWVKSIPFLLSNKINVSVCKPGIKKDHPEFVQLASRGVRLKELNGVGSSYRKKLFLKMLSKMGLSMARMFVEMDYRFARYLEKNRPHMVVVCQAMNFDGLKYGEACRQQKIPYVIVSQKAVDFYWPEPSNRSIMPAVYQHALACFFVSDHNKRLTEEQIGKRLPNAEVIFNPIKIARKIISYPSVSEGYKLACIGRFFLLDKGQDILLRIIAKEHWQQRPIKISFIGSGPDKEALQQMVCLLNIRNVEFKEHTDDIEDVWRNHHALIMPSRSEGMALVLLEAMAAGRPVIISEAGGNAEVITEGVTGFVGQANEISLEAAMERAWQRRNEWEAIGQNAHAKIAQDVPACPEKIFADKINALVDV